MWSVGLLIGLFGGAGATFIAQRFFIKSKSQEIIKNAEIEAENIRKERALQSKEKFLKQKEEHEKKPRQEKVIYRFSRPIYDSKNEYALMSMWVSCGSLCGHGCIYLFKKIDGVWQSVTMTNCKLS